MGIEHYPEVQLELPVWYRIELSRGRLNDIWIQEGLCDTADSSVHSYLDDWCKANANFNWHSDIRVNQIVWWFDDPRDAMLFKMVWA